MKKLVLVILDGLGDLPDKRIGNKTALEYAKTPNMDKLSKKGKLMLMNPVKRGFAPESDVALFSIFGRDAFKKYPGRTAWAASAVGIPIDGVVMRGNFAKVTDKTFDVRAGRIGDEEVRKLVEKIKTIDLGEGVAHVHHYNEGYRVIVRITSKKKLSSKISNTHPGYVRYKDFSFATKVGKRPKACKPLNDSESAKLTARLVNKFTKKINEILKNKRANYILLRDASTGMMNVDSLKNIYGTSWAAIVKRSVEKGMAKAFGMDIIEPKKTESIAADGKQKANMVGSTLRIYDCVYTYMKGPDEPGHDGNIRKKAKVIEEIDKHFVGNLVKSVDMKNTVICITADHSTPCQIKAHTDDPVPLMIYDGKPGDFTGFSEKECSKGGTIRGIELMPLLMKGLKTQCF
jgi:2,3-bisphosphoglycerate-independent phosphoglycerate mutase